MKNLIFSLLLLPPLISYAQELPATDGGEYVSYKEKSCISEEQRTQIHAKLDRNKKELMKQGVIASASDRNQEIIVAFDWPLRKTADLSFNSYYAITNFVDHNATATGTQYGASNLDYNCGNRTYDTNDGYNHQGVDIITWPFPWYIYDNNYVEVIAGEAGIIIGKDDGNEDDHCSCSGNWNAVYIRHADNSVAWYGHIKKNALTTKAIGQSVAKGEYLGIVASSGCSTDPHLHFEVYDGANNLIDPYAGNCNNKNSSSWWANQPAYRESTLNAALTHSAPPIHGCPGVSESPNLKNVFSPGQTVYMATYYHDQVNGDVTNMKIKMPNNSTWRSWNHTSPNTYSSSWWYWNWILPTNGPFGTWKFEVTYKGQTISHDFIFEDPNACPTNEIVTTSPTNTQVISASNSITTSGAVIINSGITTTFKAGNTITLNENFQAKNGSQFLATIEACNNLSSIETSDFTELAEIKPIEQQEKKWEGKIIPNPTNGAFIISNSQEAEIFLIDSYGKIHINYIITNNKSINIAHLPNGVYFLLIKGKEGIFSKKIIKI